MVQRGSDSALTMPLMTRRCVTSETARVGVTPRNQVASGVVTTGVTRPQEDLLIFKPLK